MTTSYVPADEVERLPVNLADRRGNGWWGMVCFVGSEATLFSALIAGYLYLRLNAPEWPPRGIEQHKLLLPSINTVILVASSAVLFVAEAEFRREHRGRGRLLMALVSLMGLVFLGIQALEWSDQKFAIDTNAYGSAFFTVTGAHGAHVVVGLALLIFLQARIWLRGERHRPWRGMHPVSLYWHFVDVVWIVVFAVLYLSERLQ